MLRPIDRRVFLKSAGALMGAAMLGRIEAAEQRPPPRFSGSVLEFGGTSFQGIWVAGGEMARDVAIAASGPGQVSSAVLAGVVVKDVEFRCSLATSLMPLSWIQASLVQPGVRQPLVRLAHLDGPAILHHINIENALLTEVRFPALLPQSPREVVLKLTGDRFLFPPLSVPPPRVPPAQSRGVNTAAGAFRLDIQGLEPFTQLATSVVPPALSVKYSRLPDRGDGRLTGVTAGARNISPLMFSVPFQAGVVTPLQQWCERVLVQGRIEPKPGVLSMFDASGRSSVASLGFVDLQPTRMAVVADSVTNALRIDFEMILNQMTVT